MSPIRNKSCATSTLMLGVLLALATSLPPAMAQDAADMQRQLKMLAPWVGETTILVVRVQPDSVALPKPEQLGLGLSQELQAATARYFEQGNLMLQQAKVLADGRDLFGVVGLPIGSMPSAAIFREHTTDESDTRFLAMAKFMQADGRLHGGMPMIVPRDGTALHGKPAPDRMSAVEAALRASSDFPVQLLVVPPEYVWRTFRELELQLPAEVGGGASAVLTEGVLWASIGFDPGKLKLRVVFQSKNADAAKQLAAFIPRSIASLVETVPPQVAPSAMLKVFANLPRIKVEDDRVVAEIDDSENRAAALISLVSWVEQMQSRLGGRVNVNQYKQILLAMHNYHDTHQWLPPDAEQRDKQGKPRLSWRVHLLPFLEQAELYGKFRLNEAWDSPHNRPLLEQMPDIYRSRTAQGALKPGYTTFLAPSGKGTLFGGDKPTRFQNVVDGTSNTIALVEVAPQLAVPWTAPLDYQFDPKQPLQGVAVGPDGRWMAGFADGSVQSLNRKISAEVAQWLFSMNDGKPIDRNDLEPVESSAKAE
ncbi:MAG: DUF1559 domain-containing protein [Planctomycetales bacterium]|nr:DUF1559 domain-containing protein [Planctomycetales bacterium]